MTDGTAARLWIDPIHRDGAVATGEYDRVFVIVWRGRPTMDRLRMSFASFAELADRLPGQLSMLAVIEERSPPPSLAGVRVSAQAFDRFAERMAASVAVLEDRDATSRMLDAVASVNALRRRPTPSKFCADVREAAAWLAARHPHQDPDDRFRAGLVDAVEQLRARLAG